MSAWSRAALIGIARGLPMILAVTVALALGLIVAGFLGASPADLGRRITADILLSPYGWGQVIYKSTFLVFTGLSVAIAFSAGLFNIGAEGQAVIGSLCAALAGIAAASAGIFALPVAVAAAFLGGALWGFLPGWLRARFGTHEVINTIMLNFIALALSNFVMSRWLALPETVRTADIGAGATIFRFDEVLSVLRGSAANGSVLIAVGAALATHFLLVNTSLGLSLRAVGHGFRQARTLSIRTERRLLLAFVLAGGLAGLAATNFVLGYKHYYEDGYTGGIGFMGIAVALVARNSPLAVLPAALLFGFLSQAGLVVNTLLPREVVDLLTGVILLVFIAAERLRGRWIARWRVAGIGARA